MIAIAGIIAAIVLLRIGLRAGYRQGVTDAGSETREAYDLGYRQALLDVIRHNGVGHVHRQRQAAREGRQ